MKGLKMNEKILKDPGECLTEFKGKMCRFHLRNKTSVTGLFLEKWANKYNVLIAGKVACTCIHINDIRLIEILPGLSLQSKKNVCSFIYCSVN